MWKGEKGRGREKEGGGRKRVWKGEKGRGREKGRGEKESVEG